MVTSNAPKIPSRLAPTTFISEHFALWAKSQAQQKIIARIGNSVRSTSTNAVDYDFVRVCEAFRYLRENFCFVCRRCYGENKFTFSLNMRHGLPGSLNFVSILEKIWRSKHHAFNSHIFQNSHPGSPNQWLIVPQIMCATIVVERMFAQLRLLSIARRKLWNENAIDKVHKKDRRSDESRITFRLVESRTVACMKRRRKVVERNWKTAELQKVTKSPPISRNLMFAVRTEEIFSWKSLGLPATIVPIVEQC